jgi:hypothetical protein
MGGHDGVGVDLDAEAGLQGSEEGEEVGAIEGRAHELSAGGPAVKNVVPAAGRVEAQGPGHGNGLGGSDLYAWSQSCGQGTWHLSGRTPRPKKRAG